MKIGTMFVYLLSILIIFAGCGEIKTDATNALKITPNDEKTIQKYCDTKTDDIDSSEGKRYSAFELLGTDKDRIYIWLIKTVYIKNEGQDDTPESGSSVSLPVVLYIKNDGKGITIISHKWPHDGKDWGRDVVRLFPPNIRKIFPEDDAKEKLIEGMLIRATEDFKKK